MKPAASTRRAARSDRPPKFVLNPYRSLLREAQEMDALVQSFERL